jgi:hypothetical protein
MGHIVAACLVALAGLLAAPTALANASASVTVNGTTRTLSQTGFIFEQVGITFVTLAPGQSGGYSFNYSLSVQDDGLPASLDFLATGCPGLHLTICQPPYNGFEYAKAALITFYQDPRVIPSYIQISGDSTLATLSTAGDAFADALKQSDTIDVSIRNGDGFFTYQQAYATYVALWVLASPVPEPALAAQLLAGLGLMAVWAMRRRGAVAR